MRRSLGAGYAPSVTSRVLQHLQDLVAIPSVNPMGRSDLPAAITGERRCAEHVRATLARLHVDSVLVGSGDRLSVIGEVHARDPIDTVLIASHLDTVPVDGMEGDPFDPVVRNDKLYGRGSCDTKAGMAALLAALERVLAHGRLRRNVIIVGEADEEMTSAGVTDVLAHLGQRRADWVLATEPTGMRLVTAHKGRASIAFEATGRACHSSDPDQGDNAILTLCRAALALEALHGELRGRRHALLGPGTLSVSVIGGGQAPNVVPHRATLIADRRLVPGEDEASVRAELARALAAAGVSGAVRITELRMEKDALSTDDAHASVRACRQSLDACALASSPTTAAFGTDAGPLAAAGMPGVVLGPGDITQAHTADEHVALAQVDAMQRFFEHLLAGGALPT